MPQAQPAKQYLTSRFLLLTQMLSNRRTSRFKMHQMIMKWLYGEYIERSIDVVCSHSTSETVLTSCWDDSKQCVSKDLSRVGATQNSIQKFIDSSISTISVHKRSQSIPNEQHTFVLFVVIVSSHLLRMIATHMLFIYRSYLYIVFWTVTKRWIFFNNGETIVSQIYNYCCLSVIYLFSFPIASVRIEDDQELPVIPCSLQFVDTIVE